METTIFSEAGNIDDPNVTLKNFLINSFPEDFIRRHLIEYKDDILEEMIKEVEDIKEIDFIKNFRYYLKKKPTFQSLVDS